MIEKPITNVSLFSGAGGLDIGLERAGFETRVCVENEKYCRNTLDRNRKKFSSPDLQILGDVTDLPSSEVLELSGLKFGELDLISGGPPCQAFSTAGHRESINDPRGQLFEHFVRMVKGIQPRFFVMENVRGLRSAALKHRPLKERGEGHPPLLKEEELGSLLNLGILPDFKRIGYQLVWGTLNALDYGAAQDRDRLFIIGSRDSEFRVGRQLGLVGLGNRLPEIRDLVPPSRNRKSANGAEKPTTLGEAIRDLEELPGDYIPYSPERARLYDEIPEGCNWRYIRDAGFSEDTVKEYLGGAYWSTGGRVGFWRRLSYAKWSPTLTTSPIQKATGLCHPKYTRPLSVQEYARIQGFPDDWELDGPVAAKYRQLGNAVPTALGEAVGQAIAKLIAQG